MGVDFRPEVLRQEKPYCELKREMPAETIPNEHNS